MAKKPTTPGADLEAFHRAAIEQLKERFDLNVVYYKDADVDAAILPLVKVLNSEWTVSNFSCGGHWKKPRPHPPYVSFSVLPGCNVAWSRIWRRVRVGLRPHVGEKATIEVFEASRMPGHIRRNVALYFTPLRGRFNPTTHFASEKEWRATIFPLVERTRKALRIAMAQRGL